MSKLLRHLRQNTVAYLALFVALGGTSYASVRLPQSAAAPQALRSAKSGITCGGGCPASTAYWAYVGATGVPGYGAGGIALTPGQPQVYQTARGGVPATIEHLGLGDWLVSFTGQNLVNCARFANLTHDRGSVTIAGYDSVSQWNQYAGGIHVMTTDATGNPADLDFVVGAFCGTAKGVQFGAAPPATGNGGAGHTIPVGG
jgi:hypothetical protein